MIARVIVDIKHKDVDQIYDYIIPEHLIDLTKPGMRVLVPFGPQKRLAIIVSITSESIFATKEIISVLDIVPTVDELLFEIIDYLNQNPKELLAQVYETAIPKQLWVKYKKVAILLKPELISDELKDKFNRNNIWHLKNKDIQYRTQLKKLSDDKIVSLKTILEPRAKDKNEVYLTTGIINKKLTPLQQFAYDTLKAKQPMLKSDLIKETTNSVVNTLIKYGIIIRYDQKLIREETHTFNLDDKEIILNKYQIKALDKIKPYLNTSQTILLNGITGSGKTEVYLNLCDEVLKQNKQALILVPEILLIGPMAQRFKAKFTDKEVIVFHSNLSEGTKFDYYQKIKNNQVNIIIGTRSAIFLPLDNLGVIIIDEEHDSSYIQTDKIYYKAHDIAQIKAKNFNIPLILGSATPSIESMYRAETNQYQLVNLTQKAVHSQNPNVYITDMREELKNGNTKILSASLKYAIDTALNNNEQAMLLINQKGYAPFVMCRNCGYVPKDPETQTSLVYYKNESLLKSKYSRYKEPFTKKCSQCGQAKIREVGFGSEYIENEIKKMYPTAKVLRMDADTTRKKGMHEKLWLNFLNHKADILIGTQMIAKGLDFPGLTVVGILMADVLLKISIHDAHEKAFMMITQAMGRSGRHKQGNVYIQTYDPDHFIIKTAASGDYQAFYKEALYERKLLKLPPFGFMHQILVEGSEYLKTYQYAFTIKKELEKNGYNTLGPTQSTIMKYNDKYRFILTIKFEEQLKPLKDIINAFDDNEFKITFYYYPNIG